ncbi:MAG: proline racemase family protein [Phycisphaeraceae bacterium]|nr:proline racemase family protein [Phycisphaeraceae bacterium]
MSANEHASRPVRLTIIDSHTEGEPTRVVLGGAPDLLEGLRNDRSVAAQARVLGERHDWLRRAAVLEPRGSDVLVGALVVPPSLAGAVCGVIFFNNVGLLNTCGHGTIGLAATLAHLGRIGAGTHLIETPAGPMKIMLDPGGGVTIENVPSFLHAMDITLDVPFGGATRRVRGDVAWGGNWFFLSHEHGEPVTQENIAGLTSLSRALRRELEARGVTGDAAFGHGGMIDHIELTGPPSRADCDAKNFVLCPGGAFDRSPCGTGTSAAMACRAARGLLAPGAPWRQESIIGSRFVGRYEAGHNGRIVPFVQGKAWITAESTLLIHPNDPYRHGLSLPTPG